MTLPLARGYESDRKPGVPNDNWNRRARVTEGLGAAHLIVPLGQGVGYDCRWPVKRKRALLGSNPPRNSRLETHPDGTGSRSDWPAPTLGRFAKHHLSASG